MNEHVLTVSLLTQAISQVLEEEFPLVHVLGEVSNYKRHQSGHRYFTLKDEGAQIRCVLWRGRTVPFELQDGMQVKVRGRLSVYPLQGNYQIDCWSVQPAGVGDLYLAFEQLKKELAAAGYFDPERKRRLPRLPQIIGVATSPSGAAIRDILTTLERRNPAATVVFRPTLVQGADAAEDIARALAELESFGCDVIIVGRGGGSIEDLWAFNTRTVADAIFRARVPIVSAVGHETDVTIADFVADVRAATPTAAAELCTPIRREDVLLWLDDWVERTRTALASRLDQAELLIADFLSPTTSRMLSLHHEHLRFQLINAVERLRAAALRSLDTCLQQQEQLRSAIALLHPLGPLDRGFALIERDGRILPAIEQLAPGDQLRIHRLRDSATASVTSVFDPVYQLATHDG
ncbi:MAG: exodeoxyribonuclease 7 large subunit [Candidatus Kapaibacterium sp.]|nr:MAG: exodeoxyribonuclease 7 large subunit [Candidatus Kapabacteria bacterium]